MEHLEPRVAVAVGRPLSLLAGTVEAGGGGAGGRGGGDLTQETWQYRNHNKFFLAATCIL